MTIPLNEITDRGKTDDYSHSVATRRGREESSGIGRVEVRDGVPGGGVAVHRTKEGQKRRR